MQIKLEKFDSHELHLYDQLVANEKVVAMITERALAHEEAKQEFERLIENNQLHSDFGNFKILDANTGQYIGLAKLEIQDLHATQAELGYMLLPRYWGKVLPPK